MFVLEHERETCKAPALYKSYLK